MTKITVSSTIQNNDVITKDFIWDSYTNPIHIVNWNYADPSWHCPVATNDMKVGGKYTCRMEEKNNNNAAIGFDFIATYTDIKMGEQFTYVLDGDNRVVNVQFHTDDTGGTNNDHKDDGSTSCTRIVITFDAENENSIEMQQSGWQMILNNFQSYVETKTTTTTHAGNNM